MNINIEDSFLFKCENVDKKYKKKMVLNNINFKVKQGEKISIIGSSGSGKTTLLNLLSGLDSPSKGTIYYKNLNFNKIKDKYKNIIRKKNLGFIYQFHHLLSEFTVLENISIPLIINKLDPILAYKKAYFFLKKIGLEKKYHMKPSQLSGGEKQRVACIRSLINKPDCILADEPTGNLDIKNSLKFIKTINFLNKLFNTTIIIVTHDIFISKFMNKQFFLKNGKLYRNF